MLDRLVAGADVQRPARRVIGAASWVSLKTLIERATVAPLAKVQSHSRTSAATGCQLL